MIANIENCKKPLNHKPSRQCATSGPFLPALSCSDITEAQPIQARGFKPCQENCIIAFYNGDCMPPR